MPPGQEGKVTLKINTSHYSGRISKYATVYFATDPPTSVKLWISGAIEVPIAFIDKEINKNRTTFFLRATKGEAASKSVAININKGAPVEIESIESTNSMITTELKTISPGKEYELLIGLSSEAPAGRQTARITVKTSSEQSPETQLSVSAWVVDPATAGAQRKPETKTN